MSVSRRYTAFLEGRCRAMAMPRARRREGVGPGFRREQQFLQIGLRRVPQPPPLLDGQKHRRLHATLDHELWPFPGARFEKLAEPGLRLMDLPCVVHAFLRADISDHLYDYWKAAARLGSGYSIHNVNLPGGNGTSGSGWRNLTRRGGRQRSCAVSLSPAVRRFRHDSAGSLFRIFGTLHIPGRNSQGGGQLFFVAGRSGARSQ